ncbi:A24 family peptidase [Labrys wisconsinensis]|uniref:Prepilin peptidase CpaA n=1 Tax=Labrys wisconsinensis TaxID=425677 RepID=A0ABU0JDP9_9HYPH|nr:prepilin peptidase [Labrys wisconsinensis]MDQ0472415.1 prepilin peptidase CpaA [Labrys wisconsinensis]
MSQLLILLVFPALVVYAAVSDLLRMTIPNRVTVGLALAFFGVALVTGMAPAEIGWHLAAGALVLVAAFACFAFGWIGGGDAKMAAATALWFGFDHVLMYLLIGSALGGLLTLGLLQMRALPLPRFAARHAWIARLHDTKTGVPYGIALAIAALIIYPETGWMQALGA